MLSRRWLTGPRASAANRFCASGRSGDCSSSATQPSRASSAGSAAAPSAASGAQRPSTDANGGWFPTKCWVSMSKPTTSPGAPSASDAPVVRRLAPARALATALPAVHPLAALGELPLDEDRRAPAAAGCPRRRRTRRWRRARARRGRRRRDRPGRRTWRPASSTSELMRGCLARGSARRPGRPDDRSHRKPVGPEETSPRRGP